MRPLTDIIREAQGGDAQAFDALVRRVQDLAFAMAVGWVSDEQRAREVTQEALLNVWTQLGQLREPAAFTGWLRRIVRKHADRRTRRRRHPEVSLEDAGMPGHLPPDAVEAAEVQRALRASLIALPDHERMAVSLYYLSGLPLREISEIVHVPEGTLKKRLHSARRRMRTGMEALMRDHLPETRPSRDERLAQQIQLFIAAREGDARTARRLLREDPELIGAPVQMNVKSADRYHLLLGMPGQQPLHLAASHGHLAVVELLLNAGADPNATGRHRMTALHMATQLGHEDVVAALLRHGATPDVAHRYHLTPLHLAAIAGDTNIASRLLQAGADPNRPGRDGHTPVFWAGARGHFALAEQLNQAAQARRRADRPFLHTGIKAVDLLAPLPRGGRIYLRGGEYGSGMMVLMGEIMRQLGPATLAVHSEQFIDASDFEGFLREVNLHEHVRLFATKIGARRDAQRTLVRDALRHTGDNILFIDRTLIEDDEISPVLQNAPATIIVFDYWAPQTPPSPTTIESVPRVDATITLSRALARQGLYPAIQASETASNAPISPAHQAQIARARAALSPEAPEGTRQRLQRYLTQPFVVYETWNGMLGKSVPIEETLEDVAAILEGVYDDVAPAALQYLGRAAEARRRVV